MSYFSFITSYFAKKEKTRGICAENFAQNHKKLRTVKNLAETFPKDFFESSPEKPIKKSARRVRVKIFDPYGAGKKPSKFDTAKFTIKKTTARQKHMKKQSGGDKRAFCSIFAPIYS